MFLFFTIFIYNIPLYYNIKFSNGQILTSLFPACHPAYLCVRGEEARATATATASVQYPSSNCSLPVCACAQLVKCLTPSAVKIMQLIVSTSSSLLMQLSSLQLTQLTGAACLACSLFALPS